MGSIFGGGGGGDTTQITRAEIPDYIEDPHRRLLNRAEDLSQLPYQPYPFDPIANLTFPHQLGLEQMAMLGAQGFPGQQQAFGQFGSTLADQYMYTPTIAGEMLGANPYLEDMFQAASEQATNQYLQATRPAALAQAVHQRSLGGTGTQEGMAFDEYQFGNTLANMAANIYGGAYAQERGLQEQAYQAERARQMQALGMAPVMQQMAYQDPKALLGIGDVLQQQEQRELDYLLGEFMQAQQYPYMQQQHLGGLIMPSLGGIGGQSVTLEGQGPDTLTTLLGLGGTALGIFGFPNFGIGGASIPGPQFGPYGVGGMRPY